MTTLKVGMRVLCVEGKDFNSRPSLLKGSIHTIISIQQEIGGTYVTINTYPTLNLYPNRFVEFTDAEYNPILYKIREMSERFEKRREPNYV